jgi:hypothetical protein
MEIQNSYLNFPRCLNVCHKFQFRNRSNISEEGGNESGMLYNGQIFKPIFVGFSPECETEELH